MSYSKPLVTIELAEYEELKGNRIIRKEPDYSIAESYSYLLNEMFIANNIHCGGVDIKGVVDLVSRRTGYDILITRKEGVNFPIFKIK